MVFGYILAIEAGIDAYIDRVMPDTWQELVPPSRMVKINSVYEKRQRRNVAIGLRSCLDLEARITILCKSKRLRDSIGVSSSEIKRNGEDLKRLRDVLAHGGSLVDYMGDPASGLRAAQAAGQLADQIWNTLRPSE